ncbi:MAG TPA: hypothetical protein PLY73_08805, partial [Candidatus Ozemobacteraceae bacterium]|nr:hypothetical protein [Candidatus Ozemobacteraceae bacterium]
NRTAWVEGVDGNGEGEWLRFDFSGEATVGRVVVSNGYAKSDDIYKKNSRIRDVALEFSGGERFDFTLADQTGPQAFDFDRKVVATWMRLEVRSVYKGWKYTDTALNEVRVEAAR